MQYPMTHSGGYSSEGLPTFWDMGDAACLLSVGGSKKANEEMEERGGIPADAMLPV
jgi:hypothetical protein